MFDIGFWELIVIAIIALLVIGPEQLPGFVRDLGRWAGRLRRLINNTRHELERGLNMDGQGELDRKISGLDDLMQTAPDRKPGFNPVPQQIPEGQQETTTHTKEHPDAG